MHTLAQGSEQPVKHISSILKLLRVHMLLFELKTALMGCNEVSVRQQLRHIAVACNHSHICKFLGASKPVVIQPSISNAGKTTFIKHLLKRDYPGINIGPEPTTDRFVVVESGLEERRTPGNTLIVQPDKPYQVIPLPFLSSHAPSCLLSTTWIHVLMHDAAPILVLKGLCQSVLCRQTALCPALSPCSPLVPLPFPPSPQQQQTV